MVTAWMLVIAVGILPGDKFGPETVHVDLVEVHQKFDLKGDHVFTQVIAWVEEPCEGLNRSRFRACGFILVDPVGSQLPVRQVGLWVARGIPQPDGGSKKFRVVSRQIRYSWSEIDPERENVRLYGKPLNIWTKTKPEPEPKLEFQEDLVP